MALTKHYFTSLLLFTLLVVSFGNEHSNSEDQPDPEHGAPATAFGTPHIRSPRHEPSPLKKNPVSHQRPVNSAPPGIYKKPVYEPKPNYRRPYNHPTHTTPVYRKPEHSPTPVYKRPTHIIPPHKKPTYAPNVPVYGRPDPNTPVYNPTPTTNSAPVSPPAPVTPPPAQQTPANNPPPPQFH
ncbi:hypothetical protein RND81_01G058400 [Saponaria officinalis]|uniref:Uncharacterized protein n=1 Tax=Saponaria officinalis TaxID=3572 RepID=A0AAW1N8V7_SAPOF